MRHRHKSHTAALTATATIISTLGASYYLARLLGVPRGRRLVSMPAMVLLLLFFYGALVNGWH